MGQFSRRKDRYLKHTCFQLYSNKPLFIVSLWFIDQHPIENIAHLLKSLFTLNVNVNVCICIYIKFWIVLIVTQMKMKRNGFHDHKQNVNVHVDVNVHSKKTQSYL